MSRHPVPAEKAKDRRALREKPDQGSVELFAPTSSPWPFLSFSHSYVEITARDGKTQLKSKTTRLSDGRLTTESFEGELDRSAYEQAFEQAQRLFMDQLSLMLRSMFLPFSPKRFIDRD